MVSISLKTQKLGFYLEYEKTRREISKRIIENSQLKQCYARNIAVSLPLNQQKKTVQRRYRPTFSNVQFITHVFIQGTTSLETSTHVYINNLMDLFENQTPLHKKLCITLMTCVWCCSLSFTIPVHSVRQRSVK